MLSKTELRALSSIGSGIANAPALSEVLSISRPQTYKVVRSLCDKEFAYLERGTLFAERKTHVAILLDILNDSPDSYIALSDSGMELIRILVKPHTVAEITAATGLHQTTITRKMDQMRRMGMVKKEGSKYSLNEELWPKIIGLASSYDEYTKLTDPRVPFGSEVYFSSAGLTVFSSNRILNDTRTAFSKYGDFGMGIHPGTNYYCSSDHEPDIRDVFLHSLYVLEKDKGWRGRMLALIFYVMHEHELENIQHPMMDEMRTVLRGGRVRGWGPLEEMNERAGMYGVELYDS